MEQSESAGGIDTPLFSTTSTVFRRHEDQDDDVQQTETDGLSPLIPGPSGRFQCTVCQQTFSRIEHLTRHSRSHAKERSLKCVHCRKGFYRIDALRRHEQIHNEPKRSSLAKGARACTACAQARRRCTGEQPCSGCRKRSLQCIYLRPHPGQHPGAAVISSSNFETMPPLQNDNIQFDYQSVLSPNEPHLRLPETSNSPQTYSTSPSSSINFDATVRGQNTAHTLAHNERISTALTPNTANVTRNHRVPQATPVSASNIWYQSNMSALNWLPDDYIPGHNPEIDDPMRLLDESSPLDTQQAGQTYQPRSDNIAGSLETHFPNITTNAHTQLQGLPSVVLPTIHASPSFGSVVDSSSPGSQNPKETAGRFYVDGDGARLPHIGHRRPKRPSRTADSATPISLSIVETIDTFAFPDVDTDLDEELRLHQDGLECLSEDAYATILHWFTKTCLDTTLYPAFRNAVFPSLQVLSYFVRCYVQDFQPVLPFLHPSTFNVKTTNWLLVLAMAAIGSHYAEDDYSDAYILAMHEFLRRIIINLEITEEDSKFDHVTFAQVRILSCIGPMYCGDERLLRLAKNTHHHLVKFCADVWSNSPSDPESMELSSDPNQDWKTWYESEMRRRVGYSIWLLDTMWAFHFQMRPRLSLQDAKLPVPCQEVLWEAQTAREWQQLYSCSSPSPSLHSALQLAYVEKRLQPSMGEFSRILLIHAIFRRTWEVEDYHQQPLSYWNPTAERQSIKSLESLHPVWLPGISSYSKWRNSACDCLDILHWHANSVIGAASGMEHPTVLHLHLARVVLLTPYRRIVNLATNLVGESKSGAESEMVNDKQHIRRWAKEDQYKARLAMIHAGVLLWHVRRYSADGFYEPSSVFIATLALWAYGLFADDTSAAANERESTPSDLDAEPFPTSMQLDRPADDELVQLFVKRGASMRANIMGVGNICSEKGPERVLLEGRRLLAGLKTWGSSRRAVSILTMLQGKRSELETLLKD
ncbi:hypothetical protein PVAG01_09620 [Phlyctema vagabunda]|uniref:Uncharacterized protein n=1 Tax=Phlyctema vagabunda TaxID=108571 RepID=A0ABR4P7Y6_9HELO